MSPAVTLPAAPPTERTLESRSRDALVPLSARLQDWLAGPDVAPETLLAEAFRHWGRDLILVTSFQAEGMVLLDMSLRLRPDLRIVTLDTGRLPEATHEFMDQVSRHYLAPIEVLAPTPGEVQRLVSRRGAFGFRESRLDRQLCCQVRKVRPLDALFSAAGVAPQAWLTGLRREQTSTRSQVAQVARDEAHVGVWKLAPLAGWSAAEVAAYSAAHGVPRHPLYAAGFTSIGCAPCTRAVEAGASERAGRWWWEQDAAKECGLHLAATGAPRRALDVALEALLG